MHPVSSSTPIWIASRQLLGSHVDEFFLRWHKVTKGFGVEDIHDLRVASRRLREGMALFAPCFPVKRGARAARKVKKVTAILGELRNSDEASLFFSGLEAEERLPAEREVVELLARLEQEGKAARKSVKAELAALEPEPLQDSLAALLDRPQLFGNERVDPFLAFGHFADEAIAARAHPIAELLPRALDCADITAQHQLRIAVKRLRYRLEILEPLFRSGFDELHQALKGYQEVLGHLHDLDVFGDLVRQRVAPGKAQASLLESIAARRSRLYDSFLDLNEKTPVDAIGGRARSNL